MIDTKHLQYFMACVQSGSFSEAAKSLYTTQSNVSKAIKNMEESLGFSLFERLPRGIRLTDQGKQIYQRACRIQKEMTELENYTKTGQIDWLRMSFNPSAWLSARFVEFYNLNYEKNYHCRVYTDSTMRIIERIRDYKDDVGFIYMSQYKMENFLYRLQKSSLEYIELEQIEAFLHLGGKYKGDITGNSPLRFIQSYEDEFSDTSMPEKEERLFSRTDAAIVTNSDYIMEQMLRESSLVNISGNYLTLQKEQEKIPLPGQKTGISFGYMKHKGEKLEGAASEFVKFLKETIKQQHS